jgi:hypothetical protein
MRAAISAAVLRCVGTTPALCLGLRRSDLDTTEGAVPGTRGLCVIDGTRIWVGVRQFRTVGD